MRDRMGRFGVLAAAALATACSISSENSGSVGEQLGIVQAAPDEFLIIANRPLELPPSRNLPRPTPGAPSRVAANPLADAHQAVFNRPAPLRSPVASSGERVLLTGAGAEGDNSAIRTALAGDAPEAGERQFGLTSFLGVPIPANLTDLQSDLDSADEIDLLRAQGYPVPAAPPLQEE